MPVGGTFCYWQSAAGSWTFIFGIFCNGDSAQVQLEISDIAVSLPAEKASPTTSSNAHTYLWLQSSLQFGCRNTTWMRVRHQKRMAAAYLRFRLKNGGTCTVLWGSSVGSVHPGVAVTKVTTQELHEMGAHKQDQTSSPQSYWQQTCHHVNQTNMSRQSLTKPLLYRLFATFGAELLLPHWLNKVKHRTHILHTCHILVWMKNQLQPPEQCTSFSGALAAGEFQGGADPRELGQVGVWCFGNGFLHGCHGHFWCICLSQILGCFETGLANK